MTPEGARLVAERRTRERLARPRLLVEHRNRHAVGTGSTRTPCDGSSLDPLFLWMAGRPGHNVLDVFVGVCPACGDVFETYRPTTTAADPE